MYQGRTWTHIVVGAGTAGCLLACRLSERDPRHRVLLIEGGRSDRGRLRYRIPSGYLACIGHPRADWMYSTEPEAGLNGRSLRYPRGKTLGGCSSINGMLFMRGQREDYDGWAKETGDPSWGWDNALKLSKRHEKHWKGRSEFHGGDGELHVEKQRLTWPILNDLEEAAAAQLGVPKVEDFNCGSNEGVGFFEVTQRRGRRWSAADAFLFKPPAEASERESFVVQQFKEAVHGIRTRGLTAHPNLTVLTNSLVDRVEFSGDRCVGVRVVRDAFHPLGNVNPGEAKTTDLYELDDNDHAAVILSAGAVSSPTILMRSGVGPEAELQRHGIQVKVRHDAIGQNLQDHLQIRSVFKLNKGGPHLTLNSHVQSMPHLFSMFRDYLTAGSGPLSMAPSQLGCFTRSNSTETRPNVEFHIQPLSLDAFGQPLHRYDAVTMSVCNLRPRSRGTITMRGKDPKLAPIIRPNYLHHEYDKLVAAESVELARRVMRSDAIQTKYAPEEVKPGPHLATQEQLVKAAGDISTTIFHPSCTVRMGNDGAAPLNSKLEVRGTRRLRVCDASVMPNIVSGNTNEPVLIIAERLADLLCPLRYS
jgi:choline dehydrogenase